MAKRWVRNTVLVILNTMMAGVGMATYFYQQDIQRARERVASGSRIARTSCGPIDYGIAGHGPTVLVVHRRHVFGARFIVYPSGDHLWVGHQQRSPRFLE